MSKYTIRIARFKPGDSNPHPQDFTIEAEPSWTILDALNEIKWHQDGSLSFRRSCRHGICGSCAMTINGVNHLACETQLSTLPEPVVVEPLRGMRVIKDLIVDMEPIYEKLIEVKPYLIAKTPPPSDQERSQSPEDRKKLDGYYECILCGCCTSSCPSFWGNKGFLGPLTMLKVWRFIADSRDEGTSERLEIINDRKGVWRCHTIFNCTEACPKDLNPTRAISNLKLTIMNGKL